MQKTARKHPTPTESQKAKAPDSQHQYSFDASRPDFSPYGLTCVTWTPSPMLRPDHHNEIELNLLRSGSLTYLLGGNKVEVRAGCLAVFWAAIPHQIISHTTAEPYHVATIPFAWFLQFRLPQQFLHNLLTGSLLCEKSPRRGQHDVALCESWVRDLEYGREEEREVVLLEMEARLRRFAHDHPDPITPPKGRYKIRAKGSKELEAIAAGKSLPYSRKLAGFPDLPLPERRMTKANCWGRSTKTGLNKVEQMACLVATRYKENLPVEEIGRAVGLHPNYAMGLFKKAFGTTLIDYLTTHRVSHAQRLLATTDDKIVEIALESGFNSISRFNDAFRRVCGCSPREFRAAHGGHTTFTVGD